MATYIKATCNDCHRAAVPCICGGCASLEKALKEARVIVPSSITFAVGPCTDLEVEFPDEETANPWDDLCSIGVSPYSALCEDPNFGDKWGAGLSVGLNEFGKCRFYVHASFVFDRPADYGAQASGFIEVPAIVPEPEYGPKYQIFGTHIVKATGTWWSQPPCDTLFDEEGNLISSNCPPGDSGTTEMYISVTIS